MVRIGMLGNAGVLFGSEMADALGLFLDSFTGRHYAKAMESRPSNLTENAHLLHCACAKEIIDRYRGANHKIVQLWRACQGIIPAMAADEDWGWTIGVEPNLKVIPGGVVMPNGLVMQYHGLRQHDRGEWSLTKRRGRKIERSKVYGGLLAENLTQCLARIDITESMNRMARAGLRLVLQVHDEVVACVPDDQAEEAYQTMLACMTERPVWAPSLPLAAEGGVDERYTK
jgi:DNA polymerase